MFFPRLPRCWPRFYCACLSYGRNWLRTDCEFERKKMWEWSTWPVVLVNYHIAMENGNELIVDLAIKMVIFHSKLLVYQAGYPPVINVASWEIFTNGGLPMAYLITRIVSDKWWLIYLWRWSSTLDLLDHIRSIYFLQIQPASYCVFLLCRWRAI